MKSKSRELAVSLATATFILSGCGGGGDDRREYYYGQYNRMTTLPGFGQILGEVFHSCKDTHFDTEAQCVAAEAACRATYPFSTIPSDVKYSCVHVIPGN